MIEKLQVPDESLRRTKFAHLKQATFKVYRFISNVPQLFFFFLNNVIDFKGNLAGKIGYNPESSGPT